MAGAVAQARPRQPGLRRLSARGGRSSPELRSRDCRCPADRRYHRRAARPGGCGLGTSRCANLPPPRHKMVVVGAQAKGRRPCRRLDRAGPGARKPHWDLVAQQRPMDAQPARLGQGGADPGDHQSRLPAGRARLCLEQGRMRRADHRRRFQIERLRRHGANARSRARSQRAGRAARGEAAAPAPRHPDRRRGGRRHALIRRRRPPGCAGRPRRRRGAGTEIAVRRSDQHPVHQRHDGLAQGGDAQPPQHRQQRLFRRPCGRARRAGPPVHPGAALPLLRDGDG